MSWASAWSDFGSGVSKLWNTVWDSTSDAGSKISSAAMLLFGLPGSVINATVTGLTEELTGESPVSVAEDLFGITDATSAKESADTQLAANRAAYRSRSELAALQLNEDQRSAALDAFQQKSAAEAALGGSGLVGGTPFWAAQQAVDENTKRLKNSFKAGTIQMDSMLADASYNETILQNNADAAQRDLDWVMPKTLLAAASAIISRGASLGGSLFADDSASSSGVDAVSGAAISARATRVASVPTVSPAMVAASPYGSMSLGGSTRSGWSGRFYEKTAPAFQKNMSPLGSLK
jgi:hypothetical protein